MKHAPISVHPTKNEKLLKIQNNCQDWTFPIFLKMAAVKDGCKFLNGILGLYFGL